MNLKTSSEHNDAIFSLYSFMEQGTPLYKRSSSCPSKTSSAEPLFLVHFSLYRLHSVTSSSSTSNVTVTSCGMRGITWLFSS